MVHTGVARPYSACRSGSALSEGLGRTRGEMATEGAGNEQLHRWRLEMLLMRRLGRSCLQPWT
jgi:hypothetical protein